MEEMKKKETGRERKKTDGWMEEEGKTKEKNNRQSLEKTKEVINVLINSREGVCQTHCGVGRYEHDKRGVGWQVDTFCWWKVRERWMISDGTEVEGNGGGGYKEEKESEGGNRKRRMKNKISLWRRKGGGKAEGARQGDLDWGDENRTGRVQVGWQTGRKVRGIQIQYSAEVLLPRPRVLMALRVTPTCLILSLLCLL
jgi:hypothetical protein